MLVSIRDLTLRLPSGDRTLTVLDGVSLDVAAGETVAVAGPSGSGKSTLLGLIGGLDAPTSGTIVVAGMEVTRLGEAALARFRRETLGYVFQSYHLIPTLTALEKAGISYAAVTTQLEDEGIEKFEKSYDELIADVDKKRQAFQQVAH